MDKWIYDNLSKLLDFPVPADLTEYIMQMQNERDLDEYLKTLLNYNDPKHRQFIAQLKKRQISCDVLGGTKKTNSNESTTSKQNDKKKGKAAKPKESIAEKSKPEKEVSKVEKKKKFVNLYSDEGQGRTTILLKGRHKCDCEARQHHLISNCINCGRIVCAQEGPGPCFFCGQLVCSSDQKQILSSNTKQADILYNKLMEQKPNKNYEESIKQRDKLLEYDKNSAQRTKVIDDESDYFQSTNTWLTTAERDELLKREEEMLAKKRESRLNQKVTFDFAGRTIVHEDSNFEDLSEFALGDLVESSQEREFIFPETELLHRPTYVQVDSSEYNVQNNKCLTETKHRIQDKEYLEMTDDGMCLSMHQPYASLLVAGIKLHEGRTWYTPHRGRLWIASTAKAPKAEEISVIENQYRILKNENIIFPDHYPTSCLLGCVTVVNVLPQEEYSKVYPNGESDSPYVFICEDAYTLPMRFPIQGKHKIYKLDPKIHRAAIHFLEKVMQTKSN